MMRSVVQPLSFGMFLMPIHDPTKPLTQCYDEDMELIVQCEELGLDDVWIGEHHSSTVENIVMPEIFIGKALGLTRRIRLGPAPVCLQYHHPVHVAGRLAFLDHLSHGRLNLCFGLGAIPTDMEVYGVDPKQSGAMVAEAMDIILKLWTSDPPYEITGNYWNITLRDSVDPDMHIGTMHRPLQRPYPPISVPCISRDSFSVKTAGARKFRLISHHMVHASVLKDHWTTYSAAALEAGRDPRPADWSVARNIFVADTTAEARRIASRNSLARSIEYILELTRRGPGLGMWKRHPEQEDKDCNLQYFMEEVIIAGEPETVTEQLLELREAVGPFGKLILVAHDWDEAAAWRRSLELFATEVMPRLSKHVQARGSAAKTGG